MMQVDTLIITVGTRQLGWKSKDGVIRSFGADGNIGYPRHIDELYQELEITRGIHEEKDKKFPWSARDLGKRYYDYCQEWLGCDFSQVELLLDQKIIETAVNYGLKHIILWGTDQPENITWAYRRLDTLWLAELMAQKIKLIYPNLRVDVHTPKINAGDNNAIREELEQLIFPEMQTYLTSSKDREFVLWIQNKGCTPAIASCVEICAAALVRQCQVFNASPNDPEDLFPTLANGSRTALHSSDFKLIPLGEYFWSLERLRVISAWERGDFSEAQLWLKVHQSRHQILYKLSSILALYTNWETEKFIKLISDWLGSKDVAKSVDSEQIKAWQEQLKNIKNNKLAQSWETLLLITLALKRENYTTAFVQFSQTLERLLYIQYEENNWYDKRYVTPPSGKEHLGKAYQPGFAGLIIGWNNSRNLKPDNKYRILLDRIRNKRNDVIHKATPITLSDIRKLWTDDGLFPVKHSQDPEVIKDLMVEVLKQVSPPPALDKLLLPSLYEWGLEILKN
jgi:hypothetical protein